MLLETRAVRFGESFVPALIDDLKPGGDQVRLESRLSDHHQIDLEPFEHELGVIDVGPQLILHAQDQAGRSSFSSPCRYAAVA